MNARFPFAVSGPVAGVLTLLFVLLVNLAPLALGSNRPLPWAYNAVLGGLILIAVLLWQILEVARGHGVSLRPILLPLCLFCLVMVWAGLQVLPMPAGYLPNPVWQVAADYEAAITRRSISVNPMSTLDAIGRLLTYACVFLCAYLLAVNPDRASVISWIFVCAVCAYAVYGLARYSLQWNKILWFTSPSTRLTGPFLGQNNAATYLGLGLVSSFALLMQIFRRAERRSRHSSLSYRLVGAVQALSGKAGFMLVIFTLILVALLLTTSRAGIAATFAGCLTLIVLRILRNRGRSGQGATRFGGLAAVAILTVVVLEMSGGRFAERIMSADLDTGGRFDVYRMTMTIIADNVWTGTGLGTFQDIFPLYRDDLLDLGLTWDKAHNDYLELFAGLGVPAALMFLAVMLLLFLTVLTGYFRRRRDSIYCSVAVAATVVVGLHGLVDFSSQIQAVAMAFAMLLGMGAAQSQSSGSTARSSGG
jgi:O-antigen ligase